MKEFALVAYQMLSRSLSNLFSAFNSNISLEHTTNADILATLALKINVLIEVALIPMNSTDKQDWSFHYSNLTQPSSSVPAKKLNNFTLINGDLHFRDSYGVLARAMSKVKARKSYSVFMIFLVEMMIQAYKGACRDKVIICLRWPRSNWPSKELCKIPGVP